MGIDGLSGLSADSGLIIVPSGDQLLAEDGTGLLAEDGQNLDAES